ncbi:MAG: hypothetical protein AB7L36_05745 [Sphingomonadaceae bacterium]
MDEALTALDPRWHQRRSIAAALRRANLLMLTHDMDGATLDTIEQALASVQALLDTQPALAGRAAHSEQMGLQGPANRLALEMSPVIGRSAGSSLRMTLTLSDGRIAARVDPEWIHEGPPGWMHGGIVAALFDEFLGLAQGELGPNPGKTGTLTVRYLAPTPLNVPLAFAVKSAWQEGRKRTIAGALTADGVETARAEAIFVVPP